MSAALSIDVVVPVFNEADCLGELVRQLAAVRESAQPMCLRAIFVNDGSRDGSDVMLQHFAAEFEWITAINLPRNFGHQAAVSAGLDAAWADYVAILDADLQDPPELVPEMVEVATAHDVDVVYGYRTDRPGDPRIKRWTANLFYRSLRWMSGLDIPLDTGDFRVMSQRVVDSLRRLPEQNRMIRAMIPWLGWSSVPFEYRRNERFAGATKYPMRKMLILAAHAVIGFSTFPIRLVQLTGAVVLLAGVAATSVVTVSTALGSHHSVPVWITSIGGLQTGLILLAIGAVGGYVFRIQDEVKDRPIYVRTDTPIGERRRRAPYRDNKESATQRGGLT